MCSFFILLLLLILYRVSQIMSLVKITSSRTNSDELILAVLGAKLGIDLPSAVTKAQSSGSFKSILKKHLLIIRELLEPVLSHTSHVSLSLTIISLSLLL